MADGMADRGPSWMVRWDGSVVGIDGAFAFYTTRLTLTFCHFVDVKARAPLVPLTTGRQSVTLTLFSLSWHALVNSKFNTRLSPLSVAELFELCSVVPNNRYLTFVNLL